MDMHHRGRNNRRALPNVERKGARTIRALVAGAAIAGGTSSYATTIRFDNSVGFDWFSAPGQNVLDVRQEAVNQPGTVGLAGTFERFDEYYGPEVISGGGGEIERTFGTIGFLVKGLAANDLIPSASPDFGQAGYILNTYGGLNETTLPEGQSAYLGLRFDPGDGAHYGWIGVVRTGLEIDAFAWGYETEPGVPIAAGAPEPGTLAALALGAAAILSRRRSRNA